MRVEDLYRYMRDLSTLDENSLLELRQMIDLYPYFQTARMLYLKNLALLNKEAFAQELEKMSVFVLDRKRLFTVIEGEKYGCEKERHEGLVSSQKEDSFSLIDAFLSSHGERTDINGEASRLIQPSVSSDYIFWSLSAEKKTDTEGQEEEPGHKLRHHDLIDSFIENERQAGGGNRMTIRDIPEPFVSSAPLDESHEGGQRESLEDSCLTETLARIYIKQKRYDKALQIIKNLSLKYPEKNIYFADQIRFLEKLIINTKK